MGIRLGFHPFVDEFGKEWMPTSSFTLNKSEERFCRVLKNIKVPDGYDANVSKCVHLKPTRIFGLKSHDSHILMQQLLPLSLRTLLPKSVRSPLIHVSRYFRELCSKTLHHIDLARMEKDIALILCQLEKIFPPAFFYIMVHLTVHLVTEAKLAGPVHYRWMYLIERIMARTKNGNNNKRPNQEPRSNRMLDQQYGVTENTRCGKRTKIGHDNHQTESHSHAMENEVHDITDAHGKRTRGPTYMARVWVRKDRKEVEFNELGQAIGPNKSEYVEFIGTLVRNGKLLPLSIKDWHNVSKSYKSKLLELVKEKFCDSPNLECHTLMNLANCWRNWKNRVKTKFFDPDLPLEQNLRRRPDTEDERVFPGQWKDLVIYWSSDAKLCDQNRDNRIKKTMDHITGKRSFAQVRDKMKKELLASNKSDDERMEDGSDVDEISGNKEEEDNVEPSRVDLFAKCYTKNGETSNPDVEDNLRKMKELVSGLSHGEKDIGPNDIFSQVVGEDLVHKVGTTIIKCIYPK